MTEQRRRRINQATLMRTFIPLFALMTAACTGSADDAETEFSALTDSGGSPLALCEAARKAEIEWRKDGNTAKIEHWEMMRQTACNTAEMCRQIVGGCP